LLPQTTQNAASLGTRITRRKVSSIENNTENDVDDDPTVSFVEQSICRLFFKKTISLVKRKEMQEYFQRFEQLSMPSNVEGVVGLFQMNT
jgi:hypothetical protein